MEDLNSAMLIKLTNTKNKIPRSFTLTGNFYNIYKKYANLRPSNISENRFFLNYQNGKCTRQAVGINKFGRMATEIASFLKLPNPSEYTGHCFRRSSATILVNAGEDLLSLKRHGGWRSSGVAEGYVDDSIANKLKIANKITKSVSQTSTCLSSHKLQESETSPLEPVPSCSRNITENITYTNSINKQDMPAHSFQNCTNVTINYYNFK